MMLRWLAFAISMAGLGLGCSLGSESATSRPGLDTLRAGLEEDDPLERTYLLTSYLRGLRPEDAQPALAEIEKHRVGFEAEEVRLFMLAWTRFDGPGAFATARDWPTPWKSTLMKEAMWAWGYNDGPAALAECNLIEDEELRESLQEEQLSGWMRSSDRLGVAEYAANLPGRKRRNRFAFRLAARAKQDGADAVIAWAEAVPEDSPNEFKLAVFSNAAGAVTRLDPQRAAAWYEREMKHWYSVDVLRSIASKWAYFHDAKTLMVWIETLPIEEAREVERTDAIRTTFRIWAAKEPGEARVWLESAPAGPSRDAAIDEFARVIVEESPPEAVRWAGQIEDEELRRKRTIRFVRNWSIVDRDAAVAWVAEADISPEWREQILANLPPPGATLGGRNRRAGGPAGRGRGPNRRGNPDGQRKVRNAEREG